jgi:hypothetical protein
VVPIREYFAPGKLLKIIGVRGISKVLLNKFRVPTRAQHRIKSGRRFARPIVAHLVREKALEKRSATVEGAEG